MVHWECINHFHCHLGNFARNLVFRLPLSSIPLHCIALHFISEVTDRSQGKKEVQVTVIRQEQELSLKVGLTCLPNIGTDRVVQVRVPTLRSSRGRVSECWLSSSNVSFREMVLCE